MLITVLHYVVLDRDIATGSLIGDIDLLQATILSNPLDRARLIR